MPVNVPWGSGSCAEGSRMERHSKWLVRRCPYACFERSTTSSCFCLEFHLTYLSGGLALSFSGTFSCSSSVILWPCGASQDWANASFLSASTARPRSLDTLGPTKGPRSRTRIPTLKPYDTRLWFGNPLFISYKKLSLSECSHIRNPPASLLTSTRTIVSYLHFPSLDRQLKRPLGINPQHFIIGMV